MYQHELPVAIIGAGPVGLAAAAHLAARRIPFLIFERANEVAASVRDWGHVRLFSPWRYNVDGVAREALEAAGLWTMPRTDLPARDRLRAGALHRRGARWRSRRGPRRAAGPARNRGVQQPARGAERRGGSVLRAGARQGASVRIVLPGASCAGQ